MRLTKHIRVEVRGEDVETWSGMARELYIGTAGALALVATGRALIEIFEEIATFYGWR